jgi:hypothetical protein
MADNRNSASTQMQVYLRGPSVEDGTVELRQFVEFGDHLQKILDRVAYRIEKQKRPSLTQNILRQDTALRVFDTYPGSFGVGVMPSQVEEPALSTTTRALESLVDGFDGLYTANGTLPEGYDQGVLVLLKDMGGMFRRGIKEMEFDLSTPNRSLHATYDLRLFTRINQLITKPEEKLTTVIGNLLSVSFKETKSGKYHCKLYLPEGGDIPCTFEEDMAEQVRAGVRQLVEAAGIGTVDPVTEDVSHLAIKELVVLGELDPGNRTALEDYVNRSDTEASFRRAWRDMLTGNTRPISELWDELDAD